MPSFKEDVIVTLVPTFKIREGCLDEVKEHCKKFVAKVKENETACAYYTFAFSEVQENGDQFLRCREGYVGADGVLAHLENVGELLDAMVGKTVDVHSVEVLGPKDDIAKLKEPLKDFNPMYFELAEGGLDTTNAGTSE